MLLFSEIVDLIKSHRKLKSFKQVADDLGVEYKKFNVWRSRKGMPYDAIEAVTTYCSQKNLNLNFFLTGEGDPEIPGSASAPGPEQLIPVIGLAEAGEGIDAGDRDYPVGISDEYITPPHMIRDSNAFFTRVEGESMSPVYRPRQRVLVNPNLQCQSGDRAVVKLKNGRKLIAEVRFKGDKILLRKYNDDDMTVLREDVVFCYKIVWAKEL